MDLHPDLTHDIATQHVRQLRDEAAGVRYRRSRRRTVTAAPNHGPHRTAPTGAGRRTGLVRLRQRLARRGSRLPSTSPSRS